MEAAGAVGGLWRRKNGNEFIFWTLILTLLRGFSLG